MPHASGDIMHAARIDAAGALVVTGPAANPRLFPRAGQAWFDTGHGKRTRGSTNRLLALAIFAVLAAALGLALWQDLGGAQRGRAGSSGAEARARLAIAPPVETVLYDTRTLPIAPESALELNAKRPRDITAVVPARAFVLPVGELGARPGENALECLAQAIYYEAASEAEAGQRAVAQVVLNRVRSPAFPNTVCGVVFQGWTRTTGCQFSFTCDGSMQRVPSLSGMARARRIAREALGGAVMASVGNATHYHADYVVPYWAASLDKVQTVGRHIFYLIRGALGRPAAFNAPYLAALERTPLNALEDVAQAEAGILGVGPVGAELVGPVAAVNPLAADLAMGKLVDPGASALIAPPASLGAGATEANAAAGRERESRLRADAAGRIDAGRQEGRLVADERKGVLERDRAAPPADPGGD
jgi:spore germination cell wall hydrolase CwlJ-like protein